MQIVPPNEVVVLISFELTLGDVRGMMNLCIPFNSLERVSNKLSSNSWISYSRTEASDASIAHISRELQGSKVEMVVTLAESKVSTSDLIGLRVGDIITTEKDVNTPLEVAIEGVTKFLASAGSFKGRKAIQVKTSVEPREQILPPPE